ncbi:fungal-specific transcription factor domain-containing protein [Stachybotrys elegans]|uniref:Fungal-specific transcription factor domain-containing protein n=1 Tax=Stachybotrys elegans TaxID=80388 RepID=A0A8K0T2H2_9HYPO|nr:fungal-specific transcription factor domain-containing protein [Stachybotrys elegans]
MPRRKLPGAPEPKRRSRTGCWPCKGRKVKCGEEHPICKNCERTGDACDYSIRLNWDSRKNKPFALTDSGPDNSNVREPSLCQWPVPAGGHVSPSNSTARGDQDPSYFTNSFIPSSYTDRPTTTSSSATVGTTAAAPTSAALDPSGGAKQPADDLHTDWPYTDDVKQVLARASARRNSLRRRLVNSGGSMNTNLSLQTMSPVTEPARKRHKRANSVMGAPDYDAFDLNTPPAPYVSPALAPGTSPLIPLMQLKSIVSSPLTPGGASSYSDDALYSSRWSEPHAHQSPGTWCSVGSESTGSPVARHWETSSQFGHAETRQNLGAAPGYEAGRLYGYDLGKQDEDIVKNDDAKAISRIADGMRDTPPHGAVDSIPEDAIPTSGLGLHMPGIEPGILERGYYDRTVPVLIPWELEPLPDKLRENPMDLMYFHHFLDHTARVLVPYHDPQSNPFRTILPKMAVENDYLLSLVLAYSASHRARLLRTQEPAMRMAQWVEDIFPTLRAAVNNTSDPVSDANLASAIMLASLEIVSPKAFGYSIPWQQHLRLAREMVGRRLTDIKSYRTSVQQGRHCWFLWSWFAYLDVLGSFSLRPDGAGSPSIWLQEFVGEVMKDIDEIDCIMGFSARCALLLAQTAELATRCDSERIGPDRRAWPDWIPGIAVRERARQLETELTTSLQQSCNPCRHMRNGRMREVVLAEILATNRAFHWAGLVHIQRRVLGKPREHADVQGPVREILQCMEHIRLGGTAETGLLFPMFTAGCEILDERGRGLMLGRFKSAEGSGLMQVCRARQLMERSWEEDRPWETLVEDEFIG